ncbi:MAG: ferrous iron transporter B [Actinomycetaceae bacterium]|nr:ferrous iron transporter B [Arcanobacterium sp.]MDD7504921.1 ferrous iron transporter B [Actinomycetaceae bacterium]MDY6143267.1 ferrous iron transporter B [Arcanobacterium sp.]
MADVMDTKAHQRNPETRPAILLVGNTNVGKSTLFNGVTGGRQAMVNAPGTTVEVMQGLWKATGAQIYDLPGTYSLIPQSPDEEVVAETVSGKSGIHADLVLAVLDGSSLTRSLYILAQIGQTGHPVAVLISMADVAAANGVEIDPAAMTRVLGVPVMTFDARKPKNYPLLNNFVSAALKNPPYLKGIEPDPTAPGYCRIAAEARDASLKTCLADPLDDRSLLSQTTCTCGRDLAPGEDCVHEVDADGTLKCNCGAPRASSLKVENVRIGLRKRTGEVVDLDAGGNGARTSSGRILTNADADSGESVRLEPSIDSGGGGLGGQEAIGGGSSSGYDPHSEEELQRAATIFSWVERVEQKVEKRTANASKLSRSDKLDRILLNPFVGPVIFFAVMWVLFKLAAEWIGPIQDFFDSLFTSTDPGAISFANAMQWLLNLVGLDGTWVQQLLIGGLAAGLGVVASFVPLMFVIFAAISMLEDSGYLARAAFLADRLMRKIGLDGRVILPLIMGFGCNLPSLAAARALPSATQRLVTAIITPYTSCAARLTIYLMIAKIFFPHNAGTVVFAMYVASIVMVTLAAWVLKFFITKHEAQSPLMLILPAYHVPRLFVLVKLAAQRSWAFVKGAGKIIVMMTLIVWLLGAIPMGNNAEGKGFASPDLAMEDSAYGQIAQALEPVFDPAGFGDWHMTGALMTGFVAKETVVSSIVVSYNMDASAAGDAEDNGDDLGVLPELLTQSFERTAGAGYAGVGAIAFLVFVLTYTPCLATVGEQVRLIGGKITAAAVGAQLVVAWLLAVGVFQIGKLLV